MDSVFVVICSCFLVLLEVVMTIMSMELGDYSLHVASPAAPAVASQKLLSCVSLATVCRLGRRPVLQR